ncbi:hypothetical protein BGZ65_008827 [Modicella reniformis]|uniref:N-acetyltransferase domain-containing protein n=1 Tax=Modicella reniformis TaxID=1440133 RepID=A0A9P6LRY7_9FUNG|nr:hypothetical protein BGZ65_008827 [Modicella reniformis]
MFAFLRLRPMALLLWTSISTAILKFRKTQLGNYSEIIYIFSVSVLVAQGVLFLTLLYGASTQAPGPEIVGKLNEFLDQDQDQDQKQKQKQKQDNTMTTTTTTTTTSSKSGSVTKRSTETSSSSSSSSSSPPSSSKENNLFWVLEKEGIPIGSLGAIINPVKGEARLVCWAVLDVHQRKGCGTLLLKTAMNQLSEKKIKVQTVKVVLQGHQVPALRLFHKFNFQQIDRTPEWLGERVELEITTKDWIKNQQNN